MEDIKKNKELIKIVEYCDNNIIELLNMEKTLKPYESINKVRLNQLLLVKEFIQRWRFK